MSPQHSEIVLFYKYFIGHSLTAEDAEALQKHQQDLCARLNLKGRILLSTEGINGTVSAVDGPTLEAYLQEMEAYRHSSNHVKLFENIDWKRSTSATEPFPDLKISIVQEIVSTGGTVKMDDLPAYTGTHLSPQQFHKALDTADVVIDVRNTFEYNIGHFDNATNPEMVTFSSFVNFCDHNKEQWKDKQVLMYCTGGIRCEKASAMLRQRGVNNVSQLTGGIHRYLEEFGADGKFQGKNFVFDQRVAMTPAGNCQTVGECLECHQPYDELCGSRTCTVCRDLVLVCPACRETLREYHCKKHQPWKDCYFSFLEIFSLEELLQQRAKLEQHREDLLAATKQQNKRKRMRQQNNKQQQQTGESSQPQQEREDDSMQTSAGDSANHNPQPKPNPKNTRRTLLRQMEKIDQRILQLQKGEAVPDPNAPRKCRTCCEPLTICDGRCWGFWKTARAAEAAARTEGGPLAVQIGDLVQPGDHWKESRLGNRLTAEGVLRRGTVVEVKTWAGQEPNDCVAVLWDDGHSRARNQSNSGTVQPQIYRWGLLAVDGKTRLYDVQRMQSV